MKDTELELALIIAGKLEMVLQLRVQNWSVDFLLKNWMSLKLTGYHTRGSQVSSCRA